MCKGGAVWIMSSSLLSYGGRDRGQKVRACPRGPASKTVTLGLSHLRSRSWLPTEQVVGRGASWGVVLGLDMDAPWFHLPQSQPTSVVIVWQPPARGKQMGEGPGWCLGCCHRLRLWAPGPGTVGEGATEAGIHRGGSRTA